MWMKKTSWVNESLCQDFYPIPFMLSNITQLLS